MKKLATVILSIVLMLSFTICAFADMGPPNINPYEVYAGPNGTELTYQAGSYDNPETKTIVVPAGSKIKIRDIFDGNGKKSYYGYYGDYFGVIDYSTVIEAGETVKSDVGKNLGHEVNAKVTPDVGLNLRTGPASDYETLGLLPQGTEVTYEYVFSNNSGDWGYVNYNGKSGWVSLKYIEEIETTTESTAESTIESTTESVTETSSESAVSEPETSTTEISEEASEMKEDAVSVLTETKNRVIIGVAAAVIVCITAIVIIILIQRKKNPTK